MVLWCCLVLSLHWKCYVRITCHLNNIITNITYLLHYEKPQKEGLANKISSAHASLACEFCELLFLLLSRNVIHQAWLLERVRSYPSLNVKSVSLSQCFGWHLHADSETSEWKLRGLYRLVMTRGREGALTAHLGHSPHQVRARYLVNSLPWF